MSNFYDVSFSGQVDDRFSKQEVMSNLQSNLRISDKQAERMFSGRPVFVKKEATKQVAESLKSKLEKLGALANISPSSSREVVLPAETTAAIVAPVASPKVTPLTVAQPHIIEASPATTPPQVIFYERQALDSQINKPRANPIAYFISWVSGAFWVFVGLMMMLAFSPFPDGSIRRGMLFGAVLCLFGVYRIFSRNRSH